MKRDPATSDKPSALRETVRVVLPIVILAVGVGGFLVLKQQRQVPVRAAEEKLPPLVDTAAVTAHDEDLIIEIDGQVVPYREIALSAEVAGRVVRKAEVCRAGKYVRSGELLLEIDPRDYELEKRRLEKELRQAEVSLEQLDVETANAQSLLELANEELELQQAELNRQKELASRRVATATALDQAKQVVLQVRNTVLTFRNELRVLSTRRLGLQSAMELISVRMEQAELNLERTRITAPIDGMVVLESVEADSYVQKGTPLVTLEDTSAVEVKCNLRVDELYWLWNQTGNSEAGNSEAGNSEAGDSAADTPSATEGTAAGDPRTTAAVADYQIPNAQATVVYQLADRDYAWQGRLWRYDGIGLDAATRTVPCRVLVDQPRQVQLSGARGLVERRSGPPALVRGMFVSVRIHARPQLPLLAVPERAVQPGHKVWRVRQGRLLVVKVEVVEIIDDVAIFRADPEKLRVDDHVVTTTLAEVTDGMSVRERPQS